MGWGQHCGGQRPQLISNPIVKIFQAGLRKTTYPLPGIADCLLSAQA